MIIVKKLNIFFFQMANSFAFLIAVVCKVISVFSSVTDEHWFIVVDQYRQISCILF